MSSSPSHDHSDHSDSSSDSGSNTSTLEYGQESFETYQTRVRNLLSTLYGSDVGHVAEIARLFGGSSNRIIGVTLLLDNRSQHFILRVPRFDDGDLATQVGVLRALRSFFPVPVVKHYDTTTDNPLGQPYILMHRLPGQSLYDVLDDMSIDERCDMARQVARLIAKVHSVHLPPGVGPLRADTDGNLRVRRILKCVPWRNDMETIEVSKDTKDEEDRPPIPATFSEFVATRLAVLRASAHRTNRLWKVEQCDQVSDASESLLCTFALSNRVVLFHRDLHSRNLLVDRTDTGAWTITGVLDWDDCEAAPYEIAGVWPGWLWQSEDHEDMYWDDHRWDPDMPVTSKGSLRVKRAFVKEMEKLAPGFRGMARRTRDGCLRQLYEIARRGSWAKPHDDDVDQIVALAQKIKMADADETAEKARYKSRSLRCCIQ